MPSVREAVERMFEAGEPTGAREHVCGPGVILTASVKGARSARASKSCRWGARKLRVGRAGRAQASGTASRIIIFSTTPIDRGELVLVNFAMSNKIRNGKVPLK